MQGRGRPSQPFWTAAVLAVLVKTPSIAVALCIVVATMAGCMQDKQSSQVLFETSLGDFVVELWPDKAPRTVENFLQYVDDGFYDGLTFHRIFPGFVVQGGGYEPDHETLRTPRGPIANEAKLDVPNEKWTLSMARLTAPDTATSQFFINLDDNPSLDKTSSAPGYAVFGKVITGRDTIEAMTKVTPGRSFGQAGGYFPADPIIIEKASRGSGHREAPVPEPPEAFACPAGPVPGTAGVVADTITPGIFCITHSTDEILVWARNFGDVAAPLEWSLTGPDGGSLPDGWNTSFAAPGATLGAARSATEAAHTMMRVMVPSGEAGVFPLELRTGNSVAPLAAHVDLRHPNVAKEGDSVNVAYTGRCVSDGRQFDSGEFPLTLGGGRAIIGFDRGVIGMGLKESATIYLPAPMAYGYNGGPCSGDQADLIFDVEIRKM